MVEQLGFATRPRWSRAASRVHVGDDQRHVRRPCGTPRSCRRRRRRRSIATGAHSRERVAPAEKSAMSMPVEAASAATACTVEPRRRRTRRACRRCAREARQAQLVDAGTRAPPAPRSSVEPTAPVAPEDRDAGHAGLLLHRRACRARTRRAARARRSAPRSRAIMQLILIGDVEIMRRLMPRSASVRNILAAMPGCERMPAPISETLPMSSSSSTSSGPSDCLGDASARAGRRRRPRAAPRTRARRRRARRSG